MDIPRLKKWVEEGSPAAATALGVCYFEGMGVEVDYQQAFRLLAPAAQRGVPRACYYLGRIYSGGLGMPVNMAEALKLFQRAAEGGEFFAMMELGRAYAGGTGVAEDREMARKWYSAAVAEEADLEGCDEELREAKAYLESSKKSE